MSLGPDKRICERGHKEISRGVGVGAVVVAVVAVGPQPGVGAQGRQFATLKPALFCERQDSPALYRSN